MKARIAQRVRAYLDGFGDRQRERERRRQIYLANAAGDFPVYMGRRRPIQTGKAAFETPRTHHVHVEITEVQ
jgi:hypothetical protein